ncbi:MAG: DUF1553 domain-containing protein [Planctomycetes bacterium]|nr:DUF1553 domain-containing protein [Planctomycetota bacterium]
MIRRWIACLLVCVLAGSAIGADGPDQIEFNRDIRPILFNNCIACHGPDVKHRKHNLRFDTPDGPLIDLEHGRKAIVPGDPDHSEMVRRITAADPDDRMPPAKAGKPLTPQQIALIKKWIQQGAVYQGHWAFEPIGNPKPPAIRDAKWARNGIDNFVGARLEKEGLKPSPEADRATLIRRVSLDLTGLPPTHDEVVAFENDQSPDAYEKVVDRLLASPHYGEHMTRYWLDAARYADTHGYQYDTERTQWPWRDWVIKAFNDNMPFDRFTVEQIAGDLMPDATPESRLATAFNRNHPITIEGGVIDEEYRTEYVIDRIVTTSTTWLGLTMGCCRCHDHKFDPLTREDFYSFFAFFNNIPEIGQGNRNGFAPTMKAPGVEQQLELAALDRRIAEAKDAKPAEQPQWIVAHPTQAVSEGGATLTVKPDESILASGANPAKDVYTLTIASSLKHIEAIQLEALTDPSLPFSSPARSFNGNFVLSEVAVAAAPAGSPDKAKKIPIVAATADYSQNNYEIENAIDGKPGSGWAVDGNQFRVDRTAEFTLAKPIDTPAGAILTVTLRFDFGQQHTIGHLRISASEKSTATPVAKLEAERDKLVKSFPTVMIMSEMDKPRPAFMLTRGQYDQVEKDHPVHPHTPTALPPMPEGAPANRLGLAQWIVAPDNPLTARVIMNRFWQQCFGVGICKTAEDFGTQGEWPSHPKLLDYLARQFIDSKWDVKHMMKTIVMSATYRQSSVVTAEMYERDPENRLLSRGPRFRMPAEMVRDNALKISGLLVEKIGGPSVYPYQPAGLWMEINNRPGFSREYPVMHGEDLYRRSMYSYWKRTLAPTAMLPFDAPEREYCVVRRSRTNTPLAALVVLNDPQFIEAARMLGQRMMLEGGATDGARLSYGYELATAHKPTAAELSTLQQLLDAQRADFKADPSGAQQLLAVGDMKPDARLDPVELAAFATAGRAILNLDQTITKE